MAENFFHNLQNPHNLYFYDLGEFNFKIKLFNEVSITSDKIFWLFVYNIALFPLFRIMLMAAFLKNKKIRKGFEGRKNWKKKLSSQIESLKYKNSIYLFHATSVGELQQALPLIRLLKKKYLNISIGISFFSPSGYDFFKEDPDVDFVCYLPLDSWSNAKTFFSIIKPKCWIISKFDIWPNHLYRCFTMKIPAFIISATLSSSSKRLFPALKWFNKSLYSCFSMIFSISEDDRKRFETIYNKPNSIFVTGDTRFDQVVFRSQDASKKAHNLPFVIENKKYLMLGSIWESDEIVIIQPTINILQDFPELNCIITPHEPHEQFCKKIEQQLNRAGIETIRFSKIKKEDKNCKTRVIIIDTIGLLAQIYSISTLAYVGGSFGTGVHNVMEPAIMGIPVLFGPRHHNSFEALQMKSRGGAFEIRTSDEYSQVVRKLLNSNSYIKETGDIIKDYVFENVGAAQRIFNKLEPIIESNIS